MIMPTDTLITGRHCTMKPLLAEELIMRAAPSGLQQADARDGH